MSRAFLALLVFVNGVNSGNPDSRKGMGILSLAGRATDRKVQRLGAESHWDGNAPTSAPPERDDIVCTAEKSVEAGIKSPAITHWEATPFQSGCGRVTAKATLVEWQTDTLAAAVSTNVRVEGFDVTSVSAITPTVRVGNYTNISAKDFAISGTLDVVDKAGRASERAYQITRKGAEIKRDNEKMLLDNIGGNAGSSTTTARQTATLGAWVKTNTSKGAGGGDPAYTSGVPSAARTDGTTRTFTEAVLTSVLSAMWTSGANAKILSVGPTEKALVSAFPGVVTKNYNISDRPRPTAIIASADVYVGQFDTVSIVPNRFQRDRDAWLLDYDYLDIAVLRPYQEVPLAKTGDADKYLLLTEYALVVRNEKALGLAADLGG